MREGHLRVSGSSPGAVMHGTIDNSLIEIGRCAPGVRLLLAVSLMIEPAARENDDGTGTALVGGI